MGFPCEFNYILRLRPEQGLDEDSLAEGHTFNFTKAEHRIYPVDAPIDLANEAWEIIARVVVREFTVGGGNTSGIFEVLTIYNASTRNVLTEAVAEGEKRNGRTN